MSQAELNQLLSGVAQLETSDLEQFAQQVSLILAQRRISSLPQPEAELLQQISQGLPEGTQHRYDGLRTKLYSETLTPEEHQELLALVDIIEQADANRLQHLMALSQIRQVPLPALMEQLGICAPTVHA
jgi:hypothetical protein